MAFMPDIPLLLFVGLVFSAAVSAAVFVGVSLIYGRDARGLAEKYRGQQPFTAGVLMALIRLTWAFLITIMLIGTAYTIRILYLRPLIIPYPQWAFFLDTGVYLLLTVVLIVPAILMLAARNRLKEMEDGDDV